MTTRAILFLATAMLSTALFAEEQIATTLKSTYLRAEPYSDAKQLATINARQQVTVLQRKGGWYQIRHGKQSGWLRMSAIRFGSGTATESNAGGLAQTLRFLSTGRSGSSGVTVATGIRGLDAADVANATPNHNAVNRLERYSTTPQTTKKFARSAQLKSQPLGYIHEQ